MGPLRPALLCALLLAPALDARAEDWDRYNITYLKTVVELLKRLRTTREHWAFVARERIDLEVTDNPAHVDDSVVGAYDMIEKKMFLDSVRLLDGAEEMEDAGAGEKTTAEVLAWKSMSTIVHELTHAKTHAQVLKLLGRPVAFPCVEDETLAFYEGALALFEMFDEKPELWESSRILGFEKVDADILKAWLKGPGVLEAVIARTYDNRPELLKEPAAGLVARQDRRIESVRRSIAAMREAQRLVASVGPEAAGYALRTYKELPENLRYAERALTVDLSTREVLADPDSLGRLRAFYVSALAERRARLEERRRRLR